MHALLMIYFVSNRLFLMLQRFPVESKGRRKKLQEVFCESDCLDCGFFESTADVLLSLDWFLIYILVSVGWLCNHHMFRMFLNQMCNGESVGILSVASNTWYKSKTYLNIFAHSKNKKKNSSYFFYLFILFVLQMCFNALDKAADLDVLNHPVLSFVYYLVRFILQYILAHSWKCSLWPKYKTKHTSFW